MKQEKFVCRYYLERPDGSRFPKLFKSAVDARQYCREVLHKSVGVDFFVVYVCFPLSRVNN